MRQDCVSRERERESCVGLRRELVTRLRGTEKEVKTEVHQLVIDLQPLPPIPRTTLRDRHVNPSQKKTNERLQKVAIV